MTAEQARVDTDAELDKLRLFADRNPEAKPMGVIQQVRFMVLDGWLAELDTILEDRRLHRWASRRLGNIWEQ